MTAPPAAVGPSKTAALLCDADGNLFPSEEPAFVASAEVTNAFLAHHGIEVTLDPVGLRQAATGRSFRATIADIAGRYGVDLTEPERDRWVDRERRAVTERLAATLRPDGHVREPLDRLARRFTLATVSSSAAERVGACLEVTGLARLFPPDRRFSAEDSLPAPTSKPDPAVHAFACRSLGVSPRSAVAVEDSVPGVHSAVGAGIVTVGNLQFVPEDERRQRAAELSDAGAAAVVRTWAELEVLLRA